MKDESLEYEVIVRVRCRRTPDGLFWHASWHDKGRKMGVSGRTPEELGDYLALNIRDICGNK